MYFLTVNTFWFLSNYFDLHNGMDIFVKLTTEMVLDGIGLGDDYLSLADWGMDTLVNNLPDEAHVISGID